jgi:hypothetical protein
VDTVLTQSIVVSGVGFLGGRLVSPILDLGGFYRQSWALVDFFLLFALFSGTARATIGRRFEGREGQLVSLALGAILSMAALGLEVAMGINLTALGPVAAVIFLLLVGAALFLMLRKLGLKVATSAASAVLVLGLGLAFVSPEVAEVLGWVISLVQFAALIGLVMLGYRALERLGELRPGGQISKVARDVKRSGDASMKGTNPGRKRTLKKELKEEKRAIAHQLKPVTRKEEKDSSRILRELKLIQGTLQKGNLSTKDRKLIAEAMSRVPPKRHALRVHLERVQRIDQALLRFDARAFTELRQRLRGLDASQQRALRRLLLEERRKVDSERRIARVEQFVKSYDTNAARCLERSGDLVVKGDLGKARQWIDAAVRYEQEAQRTIERIRAVERMLIRVTKAELRQVRKAA